MKNEVSERDSILKSVKKICNIPAEDTSFDTDIILHINTALMILKQLGIGKEAFKVEDDSATWDDILLEYHNIDLEGVKTYVGLKVKLIFDPPSSATVKEAYASAISELEWRLNVSVDPKDEEVPNNG